MLALLLLAQVAASTASPPSTAPALGAASTAVSARPKTLADLARERKLGRKGVAGGTLSVAGAEGMPAVAIEPEVAGRRSASRETNTRLRNAEADVKAARRALDDAAVRKGMTSEDTAAARRKLAEARRELNREREAETRPAR